MKNLFLILLTFTMTSKAFADEPAATALFLNNYGINCDERYTDAYRNGTEKPEVHVISYLQTGYEEGQQKQATLFIYSCFSGAYNFSSMFIMENEYNEINLVSFAEPTYDVVYGPIPAQDPNSDFIMDEYSVVDSITVTGIIGSTTLTNAFYDPATQTITDFAKFRGIGDASSSGKWVFQNGYFILKRYEVDSSYDGEMNPLVLIDYP